MIGPGTEKASYGVEAWLRGGLLLEKYCYAPGPAQAVPRHSHEEYQVCLSLDFPGVYGYRGTSHAVPVGSLSVVHPGEVHSARDPEERLVPSSYRVMYAEPALLADAATEVAGHKEPHPFFRRPIIMDGDLAGDFLRLHVALEGFAPRLEQDARLLSVLTRLVERHAGVRPSPPPGRERRAVGQAREYLVDNLSRSVALEELASLTHLSPFHLARVFRDEVGLPPHAYQTQARLGRARSLLLRGWPPARVARETGFADQSHLIRRFKRLVGVTPGRYVKKARTFNTPTPGKDILQKIAPERRESRMESAQTPEQAVADHDAIRRIVDEIDNAVDAKDWPLCRTFFTDEIYADFTSLAGGEPGRIPADGLVGAWRTNLHADKKSHHMRSNHRITVDGDRAEVFSKGYALNILNRPTGSDLWEVWGDYTHTLERLPAGWKCSGMTFVVTHARGNEMARDAIPG